MAYMHIENLYKAREILNFKKCYALEKIHGTSAHISYTSGILSFFSGGIKHDTFLGLFDIGKLENKFINLGLQDIVVFGEAYGGKCQKMKDVYGIDLKFIAFDVKIENMWLNVPEAEKIVRELGLEFVDYIEVDTTIEELDKMRDSFSVQSFRNGMGENKKEGIVLRPLFECYTNRNERVIAKYKTENFRETNTARSLNKITLETLADAKKIADEWVTEMRMTHILDKYVSPPTIIMTSNVIKDMIEDVIREAGTEIVFTKETRKEIGKKAAIMFKRRISKI